MFSEALLADLTRLNPWWDNKPMPEQPPTRRHLVSQIHRRIELNLAPIVVVRGPRQIGKTTAQMQVIDDLLKSGVAPHRVLRVQFDELEELTTMKDPVLRLCDWFEKRILGKTFNEAAANGIPAYLFFDEVQNLKDWAPQLKFLVDSSTVRVFVTGSSALRIERERDSLAGRISSIETGVLSLTEIGMIRGIADTKPFLPDNGLEPLTKAVFWQDLRTYGLDHATFRDTAFSFFSERGGYPLVHKKAKVPWPQIADQLNETVIKRVIKHDLRVGEVGRKRDPVLLEELFRLVCRYAGQSPSVTLFARETQRALQADIGTQRIRTYLRFLADTLLIRLVEPLEIALKKKKGNAKLCLVDHGLRASWLQEQVPLVPDILSGHPEWASLAGHLAESITGAALSTINGLQLAHLPVRNDDPEVDFVMIVGALRIPVEVKYQTRIEPLRDTEGLRTFLEKKANNAPFGLLIVQDDRTTVPDPRIITLPLSSLMLLR